MTQAPSAPWLPPRVSAGEVKGFPHLGHPCTVCLQETFILTSEICSLQTGEPVLTSPGLGLFVSTGFQGRAALFKRNVS